MGLWGAGGGRAPTTAEKAAFDARANLAVRGFGTLTGHMKEAQFPFAVALAALAIHNKAPYPTFDAASERNFDGIPEQVLATAVGYHQFEGLALVSAA